MRTFLLLSVLSLLAACGTPSGKCSTTTCTGCCDATGQCQTGNSNLTCGSGGVQCQPCANTQACTFGVCVTQNTSGGGGGGGAGGGSGGGGGGASCSAANCQGCCDGQGRCQTGLSDAACGMVGNGCQQCLTSQTCNAGLCRNATGGGGGGATGGGTGGGATGGGTGGGMTGGGTGGGVTGGGTGGGGSSCSAATCPSGCCTAAGVCITNSTPSRCGAGGNACVSCPSLYTCVTGTCSPCAGCIDINTGACVGGTTITSCGRNGSFCQACDQGAGQSCNSGTCSGGTSCNASNCPGCCDGNSCVFPSSFTNAQCGQGAAGAACVSCIGAQTCQGGVCSTGGTDAGGFDAGTFGCVDSTECGVGECCDSLGASLPGSCISSGTVCQFGGANFQVCVFLGTCTCNGLTRACE